MDARKTANTMLALLAARARCSAVASAVAFIRPPASYPCPLPFSSRSLLAAERLKTYGAADFPVPPSSWPFDVNADLRRDDEANDAEFYDRPRFVQHIDEWAVLSLMAFYRDQLSALSELLSPPPPTGLDVLDLCSSWTSHLPPPDCQHPPPLDNVVGIGMNAEELEANPRLTSRLVRDLNVDPSLSDFPDGSFDAVLCALSVDYLTRPREVFAEVHRVLRTGGIALFSFSNRYFRKKAVSSWLEADEGGRMDIVAMYFYHSGRRWSSIETWDIKLPRTSETVLDFVRGADLFRWFATAIFRGTWRTDPLFTVKAIK